MQLTPAEAVRAAFDRLFPGGPPARLGIALSGGGDSTALLLLARDWAGDRTGDRAGQGPELLACTVDHRLRAGSAAEAEAAGRLCAGLGIPHEILPWEGWAGQGNLQDAARGARRALIADWAARHGIFHVALGHTLDDQAETVLLRLARGSGVDGLAAMAPATRGGSGGGSGGVTWLRPLLGITRAALREELEARGQGWIDDPSNEDPRFDRVKARAMAAQLAALGLTPERLARTAAHMARAREALEIMAQRAAREVFKLDRGDVLIGLEAFAAEPEEIRHRLFAHALGWVASRPYRPRNEALAAVLEGALAGRAATLHGCLVTPESVQGPARGPARLRIAREFNAVAGEAVPAGALWDNRWRIEGPAPRDAHVAATGEAGLADCPGWRETGLPRASLLAAPALWQGERLVAAPLAGRAGGFAARLCHGEEHLVSSLSSH